MVEPLWDSQISIPYHAIENYGKEYVERAIEKLKQDAAIEVFKAIYNEKHPVVVETHIESWNDPSRLALVYKLHYRLTVVQNRYVQIPVLTFTNHYGKIEWKCPACTMINSIEATFCGEKHETAAGCGRPRDNTREWYKSQYEGVFIG